MAELDTNVTTLRPKAKDATAALRAKRARRKRKTQRTVRPVKSAETANFLHVDRAKEKPNDINASVTVAHRGGRATDVTAYVAAIGLASVAALFSIKGMVQSSIEPSFPFPRKKGHDEVGHRTDKECACDRGAQKKRQVRMIGAS